MAYLGQTFDATTVAPSAPMETVPPGKYEVQIVRSEMKPTKDMAGQYLWMEMDILSGEHTGRKLFDRLNLINNNATAVEIAQGALSAICHAVGVMSVDDSEKLHFKPLVANVVVKPAQGQYSAQNEVKGYLPREGTARPVAQAARPAPSPATVAPAVQARANAPTTQPWKRATA